MRTILQEKERNSLQHYNLVHKIVFLCFKLWNSGSESSGGQGMGKIGENSGVEPWRKSEEKGDRWSKDVCRKSSFCIIDGHMSSEKCRIVGKNTKNTKVELCSAVILQKIILDLIAVFTEQGSSASQMTAAKIMDIISRLPGCARQAADAVSAYTQVKMEDAHKSLKIQKSECPDILDSSTTTQMAKIMVQCGRPSRSSWKEFGESFWNTAGRKFQIVNVSLYIVKKFILICVCGWLKIGWKETKSWSDVESTQQRSRFGRTDIFLGSCILELHSKKMRNKQRYFGQLQNHVRIANFCG